MNTRRPCSVPVPAIPVAAFGSVIFLAGCFGPDLGPGAGTLVAGENVSAERVAAVAEMRRLGEASDELPYPDAFQAAQTQRLSARQEPRATSEAAAIEAELAALAVLRQAANTPEEIADLRLREAALRQSIHEQAGRVQR